MASLILFAALLLLSHPKLSDAAANICTKNHLNPVTNATGCWCSLTTQSINDSNNCAFGKYCWEDSTCHDRGLLKIGAILQTSTLEGAVSLAFAFLALEDVNNNSSLLSSYQLEMVVQNSNTLPSAIRSFTSLMDRENVVGIVGSLSYNVLEAVEDMSNMFQLPFIASRVPPPPAEAAEAAALYSKTKKKKKKKSFVSRMSATSIQLIETLMTVLDSMDWRKMTVVTTPESEGIYHILKERISTSPNSIELNELKFISGACINETESSAADTACHLLHSQRIFLLLTDPFSTLQFFSLIKDVKDQAKYAFVVAEVRKEFIFFFFLFLFFFVPFFFSPPFF